MGFAESFEKSFNPAVQKGSDIALEAIKEKIKLDREKSDESQSVLSMKEQMAYMREEMVKKGADTSTIDNVLVGISKVNKKEVVEPIFKAVLETAKQGPYDTLIAQGKAAEASNNIIAAGGNPPALNFNQGAAQATSPNPTAPTQEQTKSNILANSQTPPSTGGSDLVPTDYNVAGVATKYKSKSGMAAEEQAKVNAKNREKVQQSENIAVSTKRFMQQFERSHNELRAFDKDFDKDGMGGFLTRKTALIAEKLDELPETKALKIQVLPLAQGIASEIEGGRVTDQDRKIQADKFANAISFPTTTNVRLMANGYLELIDKGGNENGKITAQLKEFARSDSDIFKRVIAQVLIEEPEMAKEIYGEDYEVIE